MVSPCFLFPQATSQSHVYMTLATAARVTYPADLQLCRIDALLLAAGVLTLDDLPQTESFADEILCSLKSEYL